MPALTHTLISINFEWPGFSKSRSWSPRVGGFVDAIKGSGASLVLAQELGRTEAADLASRLGPRWSYQRAQGSARGQGLNTVLWRDDWVQDGDTIDVNLPSYGQMQRTLCAVPLRHGKTGERLTAAATHFANNSATDLTVRPNTAQAGQAETVHRAMHDRRRVVLGTDSNNKTNLGGGRRYLNTHGWKITANGIDIVATLPGVVITGKRLVPVPSDHSRAIVATFTTNTGTPKD